MTKKPSESIPPDSNETYVSDTELREVREVAQAILISAGHHDPRNPGLAEKEDTAETQIDSSEPTSKEPK
jgi:hypothetical protein